MSANSIHKQYMQTAINLARHAVGTTWPNPSVGCLIVKDGIVIASGTTAKGGRPHAETIALKQAGKTAKNATMYVTLEPCCHKGKSGACTEAIIKAQIAKVVIASKDPFPAVNGQSIKILQKAGITVVQNILQQQAQQLNKGFFKVNKHGLPYTILKLAITSDGKITSSGQTQRFISGKTALDYAHMLRAKSDAILVGINTVIDDDPMLSCRLAGLEEQSPVRIVLDTNLRIPLTAKLIKTAGKIPVYIFCSKTDNSDKKQQLKKLSINIIEQENQLDVKYILKSLAKLGITQLLIEGGAKTAETFIKAGFLDEIHIITAKKTAKGKALKAPCNIGTKEFTTLYPYKKTTERYLGEDQLTIYNLSL